MNATPTPSDREDRGGHGDRDDRGGRDGAAAGAPTSRDSSAPGRAPLLNIANALTVLRLILVPVFIWLMLGRSEAASLAATPRLHPRGLHRPS